MKSGASWRAVNGMREKGFGLVELMIAMVLGALVVGAAFAVFQSNQSSYRTNEGLSRIQEGARVAFELISRDVRAAGGSACSSASVVESTAVAESAAYRDNPVSGSASQLTVLSGDDSAYRVTDSSASSVTLDSTQLADATDVFHVGDIMLLCNSRKTFVVSATSVGTSTVGFANLPGDYDPTDDQYAPPAAVVLARMRNSRWYVANNTRGGRSLFVARDGAATGEEVADGVQNIAFSYLETGGNTYNATPANWINVIAVRVDMTLQGPDVDGNVLTRSLSNVVSLRGRTL